MGLVEKTMLNSEPEEKILPPGTDQEGALAWVKEGGVVTELATKEAEPTDVEAAKYISDTLVAQDPATIMVALKTRAALWAAAREIIDEGGNATLQHADSRLAVALSATALHSQYTAEIDAAAPKAGSSKKLTVALAYGTADSAVAAHLNMEYEDALRLCGRSILKEDDEKRINKIFNLVLAITPTEAAKRVQRDAKGNPTTGEGQAKLAECIDLEAARMKEPHALIREHAAKRMRAAFMQMSTDDRMGLVYAPKSEHLWPLALSTFAHLRTDEQLDLELRRLEYSQDGKTVTGTRADIDSHPSAKLLDRAQKQAEKAPTAKRWAA